MKVTRIFCQGSQYPVEKADITERGLRGKDDLVTVTDEATLAFCLQGGMGGLCTRKFNADIIVDRLEEIPPGSRITAGTASLEMTAIRKSCHTGCSLDPAACLLNGRVLYLKIISPGSIQQSDKMILNN